MAHVVAALVAVKDPTDRLVYLYAGAIVPEYVPADEVDRLTGLGLVATSADKPSEESDAGDEPVKARPTRSK